MGVGRPGQHAGGGVVCLTPRVEVGLPVGCSRRGGTLPLQGLGAGSQGARGLHTSRVALGALHRPRPKPDCPHQGPWQPMVHKHTELTFN